MIVACGQMEATTLSEASRAWPMAERLAAQARAAQADLLVLPECAYPAYWLESVARYMQPDIERSDRVLERFAALSREHRIWIVTGFVEENEGQLHNSAAVFDRSGALVGVARKSFMWDCDNRWFTPGSSLSVFDSEFGRMGVLICADARTPEIVATLATEGAEFIIEPTAWVNAGRWGQNYLNVQADFMIRARAIEFGLAFACASKSGCEADKLEYVGQSQVVDADGQVRAKAPIGGEHLISADISPATARLPVLDDVQRDRLLGGRPPMRATGRAGRMSIRCADDAGAICDAIRRAGGRVCHLSGNDLRNFAPARCAALEGAQVLVYDGLTPEEALLRTRAAENRVFAVAVGVTGVSLLAAPDGSIRWRSSDIGESIELDLSLADDKHFTPETDLWEQRRPACFRLPAAAASTRQVSSVCGTV